jgi:hypothetical protein
LERLVAFRLKAREPAAASVSSVGAERFTKPNLTSAHATAITPYTRFIKNQNTHPNCQNKLTSFSKKIFFHLNLL